MEPLRERYNEDLQLRNYSRKTQERYQECVTQFAKHSLDTITKPFAVAYSQIWEFGHNLIWRHSTRKILHICNRHPVNIARRHRWAS
jgi:hypothetical protein